MAAKKPSLSPTPLSASSRRSGIWCLRNIVSRRPTPGMSRRWALRNRPNNQNVTRPPVGSGPWLGLRFNLTNTMKNYPNWPCECRNWCRCEPIDLTKPIANHHHACEHYEASKIDVWRVTLDGASYVTDREPTPEEINEGGGDERKDGPRVLRTARGVRGLLICPTNDCAANVG